jgi:lysophospholipase L1-like esterase
MILLGCRIGLAGIGLTALALLAAACAAAPRRSLAGRARIQMSLAALAGASSVAAAAAVWSRSDGLSSGIEPAAVAWLASGMSLAADGTALRWPRRLGIAWAFLGGWACLAYSYSQDLVLLFYVGLLINLTLLLLAKRLFRLNTPATLTSNTLILFLIALPATEVFLRCRTGSDTTPEPANQAYSYGAARTNHAAFVRWCSAYDSAWNRVAQDLFSYNATNGAPFRLRPNSRAAFFHSEFVVNSLGCRGREIAVDKGPAYRIAALGESSTFGVTLNPGDRPWPEVLEQLIRDRLKPRRPVEVVNCGVPAASLDTNVRRLADEILPLKPDMIISYHGYNGFGLIHAILPPAARRDVPERVERPLTLLADCEYRLKLLLARRREQRLLSLHPYQLADPMQSEYARWYRELIRQAAAHHIRLVLASFSMAVNRGSDLDVIHFYQERFPSVLTQIKINEAHSDLVRRLAQENPGVLFADTHPRLDGDYGKFIDLVHFTQPGREQLAETLFAAIRPALERDLARTERVQR